jgi:hypothetical protein
VHHSTALHGIRTIEEMLHSDGALDQAVMRLMNSIALPVAADPDSEVFLTVLVEFQVSRYSATAPDFQVPIKGLLPSI